ncbi:unnamed protein product [Meganyctiphanes norvegica]|uniref:CUB domain-containing protein n=1 Tax=Meganyctiphanes norvegica TaxID=48144 RepID=A0AAV2RMQ2_MEGNR
MVSFSMKLSSIALMLVVVLAVQGEEEKQNRDGKFLNLPFFPFIVVKVNPTACTTTSNTTGTCYSSAECKSQGGTKDGSCASGYGVCCKFEHECGAMVKSNVSYLVNDGYPSAFKGIANCQYTIEKLNANTCQLRLDFEKFKLGQPDASSLCSVDTFTAVAGGSNTGEICGDNSGQHMYLDVSGTSVTTRINIATSTAEDEREWRIKVTQIACDSQMRAPVGCLQYYDSYSGNIESFNFVKDEAGLRQLGNMNYAVCIRTKDGFCGIKYSADDLTGFSLTEASAAGATATEKEGDTDCASDFILIPAVNQDGSVTEKDRFCGTKLSADSTVTTYAKPFIVRVLTDATETTPDAENKGFSLRFSQVPC